MYINYNRTYIGTDGQQHASIGDFLILFSNRNITEIKAVVRRVAMRQCGHFMMGTARICGETQVLSGTYGGDGLTCDGYYKEYGIHTGFTYTPKKSWEVAIPLPQELIDAWSMGNGWNGPSNEKDSMSLWARRNVHALRFGKKGEFKVVYLEDDEKTWHISSTTFLHREDAKNYVKGISKSRKPFIAKLPE